MDKFYKRLSICLRSIMRDYEGVRTWDLLGVVSRRLYIWNCFFCFFFEILSERPMMQAGVL